jgi:hypothetical protein
MSIWYKQGVFGSLQPCAEEGLRKTERLYSLEGEDVFVTSLRDGAHCAGSFHISGRAWDMRKGSISKDKHQLVLGSDFQVIDEGNHRHIEFDPPLAKTKGK